MRKYDIKISLESLRDRGYPSNRDGFNKTATVDENGCPINPIHLDVEEYVNDNPNWGKIDKAFVCLPLLLTQDFDNVGIYDDKEFIEINHLINEKIDPKVRKTGLPLENYLTYDENFVTGVTESQLYVVQSYNVNEPYIVGLNMAENPSKDFNGVLQIKENSVVYVIGGKVNSTGQYIENTGVIYETFEETRIVEDKITGEEIEIPLTNFKYKIDGYKEYNSSLSAIVKDELLWGVVEKPKVINDLFVDRGVLSVFEKHLRLSEIKSLGQMVRYNNQSYNVTRF